ncbi:hypothetical protein [Lactovum miscens]|uniref:Uncharacterized protein n=1 Tax=Lactovum miscens TaxID=190387 RepID=A0A841C599_9LACT|nr:hypothetical protein [Lactovum miscens]MBB5887615.1 hypothetical protein [Lactovum miscens]
MDESSSNLGLILISLTAVFAVGAVLILAFPQIATSIVTYLKSQLPV